MTIFDLLITGVSLSLVIFLILTCLGKFPNNTKQAFYFFSYIVIIVNILICFSVFNHKSEKISSSIKTVTIIGDEPYYVDNDGKIHTYDIDEYYVTDSDSLYFKIDTYMIRTSFFDLSYKTKQIVSYHVPKNNK